MPVWSIVLLTILVILLVVFIALIIVGNKLRKKQESQQEQIDAAKQIMSMLVIDKKKMKLKEAGLPKIVLDQTPKYLRGSKMPIVKAKIGPRVMTLMCDPKVFEQIPVKAEIKAEVSGIYINMKNKSLSFHEQASFRRLNPGEYPAVSLSIIPE